MSARGAPLTAHLRRNLRLIVVTDGRLARPRTVADVVEAALEAGARAIQLRAKGDPLRRSLVLARELRSLTRAAGSLFFVNDRLDLALAAEADGVHLGPDDPPVVAVRRAVPPSFLIGFSADDPATARAAEEDGADYLGCGSVWKTSTKDVAREAIGIERLDEVARSVRIPVVAIGGVTPDRASEVARTAASGVAVVGAVMAASDPASAVRALLAPFQTRNENGAPDP